MCFSLQNAFLINPTKFNHGYSRHLQVAHKASCHGDGAQEINFSGTMYVINKKYLISISVL